MEKISGIYRIVCVKNGRYYFGSSEHINHRWTVHKRQLRNGEHFNPIVQNVYNKHGEASFRFELTELVPKDKLLDVEDVYLAEHVGKSNCMNIVAKTRQNPMKGKTHPDDIRKKMRMSWTPERRKAQSERMKGTQLGKLNKGQIPWLKGLTKETDERVASMGKNVSLSMKGKTGMKRSPWSADRRKAASEAKMGDKNPMYGKTPWNKK